jgi:PAS domain S-box-containing protein
LADSAPELLARIRALEAELARVRATQWAGGWIAEAVLVHDLDGQILDANERAAEMLGYSVDELRARDMFGVEESLRETGPVASRENWAQIEAGAPMVARGRFVRRDGGTVPVELTLVAGDAGGARRLVLVARDITDRLRVERALRESEQRLEAQVEARTGELQRTNQLLRQEIAERERAEAQLILARERAEAANQAKSRFLMVMSHELRTPLNAILGYTEMLIEGVGGEVPPDPDEQAVDLWRIRGAGSHLLALIDDILHMTRLESGAVVLERSRVAVAPFLRDLGAVMREQLARPDLEFVVEVDEALGEIETDTARLRHILRHLLRNAAKFTPRGSIGLRASRRGEWLHLEVRDTGIGIAAEHLGRLFAPFVQIDDSPTRRYGGLGLGLALCRRYCDELGAELSVESQVQRGSVFFVRVPVAPIARAPL